MGIYLCTHPCLKFLGLALLFLFIACNGSETEAPPPAATSPAATSTPSAATPTQSTATEAPPTPAPAAKAPLTAVPATATATAPPPTQSPTAVPAKPATTEEEKALTLLYWQAPSLPGSYLSPGFNDRDAGAITLEPLAKYDPDGRQDDCKVTDSCLSF